MDADAHGKYKQREAIGDPPIHADRFSPDRRAFAWIGGALFSFTVSSMFTAEPSLEVRMATNNGYVDGK